MKRFLAFYGDAYYAEGRIRDFIGDFDTVTEAAEAIEKAHLKNRPEDKIYEWAWSHVWDSEKRIIAPEGYHE